MFGIKKMIPQMIDFAITIPQLSHESGENIFFGVFLASCEIKRCTLTALQQKVFAAQVINIE
jgi:hypothetical protein